MLRFKRLKGSGLYIPRQHKRNTDFYVYPNGYILPAVRGGVDMFALDQSHFRFRNDDGTEVTATWKQDEDIDETILVDVTFRIRFVIQETGNVGASEDFKLQRNLNTVGWVDVSDTSAVVKDVDSADSGVNDGDATTDLIGGTGTFVAGEIVSAETSGLAQTNTATSFGALNHTEHEFVLQVVGVDVSDSDTIDLRLVNQMTQVLNAYSQIPTITVDKPVAGGLPPGLGPIVQQQEPHHVDAALTRY